MMLEGSYICERQGTVDATTEKGSPPSKGPRKYSLGLRPFDGYPFYDDPVYGFRHIPLERAWQVTHDSRDTVCRKIT